MGVTTSWYAVPHRLSVARILRLRSADRPAAEAALLLALDPDSAYARIRRDSPHSPVAAGQEVPRLEIRRGLPIGAPGWLVEGEWWAGNPSPPPTDLTPTGLARLGADVADLLPELPIAGPAWGERVGDLTAVWGHTMRLLAFLTDARLERGADGQWVCRADAIVRVTR